MLHRLLTLIVKELQALLRDPQSRRVLIMPVIIQVALFPFAGTLEVKNSTLGILNQDTGVASTELIQRFGQAKAFTRLLLLRGESEMRGAIDTQQALLVLSFPADFSRDLAAGRVPKVQAILDGRRSNSAQIVYGYVDDIIQTYLQEKTAAPPQQSNLAIRHWFNPNLDYHWFILPSLIAMITTVGSLIVTALSVSREREQGTFEQLLVSPLSPAMIMVGKAVPALLVALAQGTIILAAAVFAYRVPFQGSLPLLYLSMLCYGLALVGVGLLVSTVCQTQQQGFLGVFSFIMPSILLSGFVAPIENMPKWLQYLTLANPLRHFVVIAKGIYLKNFGFDLVWQSLWPLLLIATVTLTAAYALFQRKTQ